MNKSLVDHLQEVKFESFYNQGFSMGKAVFQFKEGRLNDPTEIGLRKVAIDWTRVKFRHSSQPMPNADFSEYLEGFIDGWNEEFRNEFFK